MKVDVKKIKQDLKSLKDYKSTLVLVGIALATIIVSVIIIVGISLLYAYLGCSDDNAFTYSQLTFCGLLILGVLIHRYIKI